MRATAIVTTVDTEEQASLISRELIARRQAACVNIVPGVRSVYRWQGKVASDQELLLIAKTRESQFEAVAETIRELHSYDVPEILTFDVGRGDETFLDWIFASTDPDAPFDDEDELVPFAEVEGDEEAGA
ncbi:MAG: divalent-cation tolerance protein CutA [Acidobacteriota bacterium]